MEYVRKTWNFHIGTEESINNPIFKFIELQQQNQKGAQSHTTDSFFRLPVVSAQSISRTEITLIVVNF